MIAKYLIMSSLKNVKFIPLANNNYLNYSIMQRFYNIVSIVFVPLLIPTYGLLLIVNMDVFSMLPFVWKAYAVGGTIFFTLILPLIPIAMMIKKGSVSTVMISKKEERTVPYLFTFFGYCCWVFFIWRSLQLPPFFLAMAVACTSSILIVTLINLKWKISAHMSAMGGLLGGVIGVSLRMGMNPAWLIGLVIFFSGLVGLARLELKAHNPLQVVAGFFLSFMLVLFSCFY